MKPSIVGILLDLLEFEGRGTFAQLDRSFRKACAFLSLDADEASLRKLRNIAFWYLRSVGYLDAHHSSSGTIWSTAPPNLVQRGERDFALIAGSAPAAALLAAAPPETVREVRSPDGGLVPETISFFPSLLCVNVSVAEARDLCRRAKVSLGLSYQSRLFQYAPSVDSVLHGSVLREDEGGPFEPESTDRFDFASCAWQRLYGTRAFEAGLYRQAYDYGAPKYVIVAPSRHKRLSTFRVVEREWILLAALALLRTVLPIRYEKNTERLYVSKRYQAAFRMPVLLERCLRSGTLLNPASTREWLVYEGVLTSSVASLITKLPMFSTEGRQ